MLVSHTKKFIYLKTTKTAGTSVEVFFERYCKPSVEVEAKRHGHPEQVSAEGIVGFRGVRKGDETWFNHMSGSSVKDQLGEQVWQSYFKFCVVRNPFDRLVSFWWMTGCPRDLIPLAASDFTVARELFCKWVMVTSEWPYDRNIYTIEGKPCVDDMIRYEALNDGIVRVCDKIGIEADLDRLPRLKAGARLRPEPYRDYYEPRARNRAEAFFAADLALLGYEF